VNLALLNHASDTESERWLWRWLSLITWAKEFQVRFEWRIDLFWKSSQGLFRVRCIVWTIPRSCAWLNARQICTRCPVSGPGDLFVLLLNEQSSNSRTLLRKPVGGSAPSTGNDGVGEGQIHQYSTVPLHYIAVLIRTSSRASGSCLGLLIIPCLCALRAELHNPWRARHPPSRFRPSGTVTKLRRLCRIVREKYHRLALLCVGQSSSFRNASNPTICHWAGRHFLPMRKIHTRRVWGRGSGKHC